MQLMPATAATFGVTNRFEIEQNIRGGVAYLARLLKLFNGDLRLVAGGVSDWRGREFCRLAWSTQTPRFTSMWPRWRDCTRRSA